MDIEYIKKYVAKHAKNTIAQDDDSYSPSNEDTRADAYNTGWDDGFTSFARKINEWFKEINNAELNPKKSP